MTISTPEGVVKAAMSVATEAAEGRLHPNELERQAVAELSALMLIEPEPGSDLEALQADSARRVLARGGIPADEVAEWLAVQRRRENPDEADTDPPAVQAVLLAVPAEGADVLTEAVSHATVAHSAESDAVLADAEPEPALQPVAPEPAPLHRRVLAVGRGLPVDNGLRPQ